MIKLWKEVKWVGIPYFFFKLPSETVKMKSKYSFKFQNFISNKSKFDFSEYWTFFLIHCRICNSTTLEMCLNYSKRADSTSKMKTNTSETETNINKVIIFVVYVFIAIIIGTIRLAFCKRLRKTKGIFKIDWKYDLFSNCHI